MKKVILLFLITLFYAFQPAPTSWKFDPVHSGLNFSLVHLTIADLEGTFKMNSASLTTQGDDFNDATVELEINMSSVDTDDDKRDAHLRTADFFDVEKFPVATFKSTSFKKSGDKYTVQGNFTMHGVTKPVSFDAILKTAMSPINNKPIAGFKVTGVIKRSDFGIAATSPEAIISDNVNIEANLEFSKAE